MTIMNMVGGGGSGATPPSFFVYHAPITLNTGVKYNIKHGEGTYQTEAIYVVTATNIVTEWGVDSSIGTSSSYYKATVSSLDTVISSTDISVDSSFNPSVYDTLNDSGKVVFIISIHEYGESRPALTPPNTMPVTLEGSYSKIGNNTINIVAPIAGKTVRDLFGDKVFVYSAGSFSANANTELCITVYQILNS